MSRRVPELAGRRVSGPREVGPARGGPARVVLPLLVGLLLVQAAWILTLPPFRGTDEIDHAYRAAEVSAGELVPRHGEARDGRGLLVPVPRSLVAAAHPLCVTYGYLGHDNCNPVADAGPGHVLVASAAATYDPAYYWVVGSLASGLEGARFLYLVRVLTALACAALLAVAAWATLLGTRSAWPVVGLLAATTPVVLFSSSVAAPNGLEIGAALVLWSTLLALTRPGTRPHRTPLLVAGGLSSVLLVTLRSIGPLWALLVIATVAAVADPARLRRLVAARPRSFAAVTGLVAAATLAAVGWTRHVGVPSFEPPPGPVDDPLTATVAQLPLWLFQGVAAFPRRHDPAPATVYVLVGLVALGLLVAGWRSSGRRWRWGLAGTALVAVAVPVVLTVTTITSSGAIWQGRYGAPYHVGLFLLAGLALDTRATAGRRPSPVVAGTLLALAAAHAVSVLHVLAGELRTSPYRADPSWVHLPPVAAGLLVAAAGACWVLAARRAHQAGVGTGTSRTADEVLSRV